MAKITQVERVLDYMREFGSITSYEAFRDLGCSRLASRIHEIRRAGTRVYKKDLKSTNRYGETVHYTGYSLKPFNAELDK